MGRSRPSPGAVSLTTGEPCEVCGQVHLRCAGHRKGIVPKVPCMCWPKKPAVVCWTHGGRTGQVVRAAEKEAALAEVEELVAKERALGRRLPIDGAEAMQEMIEEAYANVGVYRMLVEQLELTVGAGGLAASSGSTSKFNEVEPHIWVVLYNQERDRLVEYSLKARRAGVDERRAQLAEEQGRMIATVVRGAVDDVLELVRSGLGGSFPDAIEARVVAELPGILAGKVRELRADG